MKSTTRSLASVAVALLPALVSAAKCKPWVDSELLQGLTKIEDLVAGSQKLQDIADANGNNRAFGGGGHNATVDWLVESLEALDYYDVVKQPFTELFATATGGLTVAGAPVAGNIMTYTSSTDGPVTAPLVSVANLGCEAADYPATVAGNIAFISRGTCAFALKSTLAKAAGATGAIVYNNVPGSLSGTLGEPFGSYAPIIGISQEDGQAILAQLAAGEVTAVLDIDALVEERITYNVIAETKEGDHDNVLVLGGHSDSVAAGPGINDDGSGIVGVLNVATNLAKFRVHNAVRFAFWSAEEFGLLGSYFYMNSVNGSDTELAKIRAYLNFDMIASPNFMYGIYDGDGSDFGLTGPAGSDVIERDFEEFYEDKGLNHVATEFSGRSDYAAFIENGIPSGGIFTGAEGVKTDAEAALFGGEAGVAYDINYHGAGDDINNLNLEAYLVNTQSIAHTVAKYALSFDSLAPVDLAKRHWDGDRAKFTKRASEDDHVHAGPCGGGVRK